MNREQSLHKSFKLLFDIEIHEIPGHFEVMVCIQDISMIIHKDSLNDLINILDIVATNAATEK